MGALLDVVGTPGRHDEDLLLRRDVGGEPLPLVVPARGLHGDAHGVEVDAAVALLLVEAALAEGPLLERERAVPPEQREDLLLDLHRDRRVEGLLLERPRRAQERLECAAALAVGRLGEQLVVDESAPARRLGVVDLAVGERYRTDAAVLERDVRLVLTVRQRQRPTEVVEREVLEDLGQADGRKLSRDTHDREFYRHPAGPK